MSISIELARRILEACKQRARELRSPVSIAIVDAGGHLVLFERMMAPYGWATGDISIAKANTSVMFNQSTDSVAQWASAIPGFAAGHSIPTPTSSSTRDSRATCVKCQRSTSLFRCISSY